jgi:hypothetical protein
MEITREQKIDKIYEVVANKELSLGCKIIHNNNKCIDYIFNLIK